MIVPMKKVQIVVLKEDHEQLMLNLQKTGEVMLIEHPEISQKSDATTEEIMLQRTRKTLGLLKKYRDKPKFVKELNKVDYADFVSNIDQRIELLEKIEETYEEIQHLKADNATLQETLKTYQPWEQLTVPFDKIVNTKYAYLHTGFIEPRYCQDFIRILDEHGSEYELLGKTYDGQAVFFANYYADDLAVMESLRAFNFTENALPKLPLTATQLLSEKEAQLQANNDRIKELEEALAQYAKHAGDLEILTDQVSSIEVRKTAPVIPTDATVYVEGWVRHDRVDKVIEAIKETTDIFDCEFSDPLPDELPPTVTQNNRFVAPFEIITNMFATPSPYEVDPNPTMSFWYWIIFGIMMGDAGYGLVMLLFFWAFIKIKKPKGNTLNLYKILMYSGITTMIWGIVFGSYFGFEWHPFGLKPLLTPLNNPLEMLVMSLVIGGLHIISGLLVKAYDNFRKKDFVAVFSDSLSWILLLVGIGFFFLPQLSNIGKYLALAGALIIVFFAGRKNRNPIKRIGSGLYSLYGATGYMSDILSYSRILALSMSSGVIALVMNLLAQMVQGDLSTFSFMTIIKLLMAMVVYFVGHVFNLAMGLLSAYVHASRLQYIEFFGKFYEGSGYAFTPLENKLTYIDELNVN